MLSPGDGATRKTTFNLSDLRFREIGHLRRGQFSLIVLLDPKVDEAHADVGQLFLFTGSDVQDANCERAVVVVVTDRQVLDLVDFDLRLPIGYVIEPAFSIDDGAARQN